MTALQSFEGALRASLHVAPLAIAQMKSTFNCGCFNTSCQCCVTAVQDLLGDAQGQTHGDLKTRLQAFTTVGTFVKL